MHDFSHQSARVPHTTNRRECDLKEKHTQVSASSKEQFPDKCLGTEFCQKKRKIKAPRRHGLRVHRQEWRTRSMEIRNAALSDLYF